MSLNHVFRVGFNPYVECNPKGNTKYAQSTGLQTLMKEYATIQYSRPIMFGEFGCNEGENTVDGYENQRSFYDVSVCLHRSLANLLDVS